MTYWIYFAVLTVIMYVCISTIGYLSGGQGESVLDGLKRLFTPIPLALMLIANSLFAISIFYGLAVSSSALAISVAIGVVTSFIYSIFVLGISVTTTKFLGLGLILIGIYLIR